MVIISGGFGGVGQAIGKKLAEDGFDVVALYHATPKEDAEKMVRAFGGAGAGNHKAVRCDIRDERAVDAVFNKIANVSGGGIESCIHTAVNPVIRKNILEMTREELDGQLAVSFFGGFYFLKAAAEGMKNGGTGGTLIGILSRVVEPDIRYAKMAGVTIGKYALRGLLKELHGELSAATSPGPRITVNAITPDFMDTPLNADLPPPVRKFIAERAATGNIKSPEDVARAVSFLCSPAGKKVNGKIFSFDEKEIVSL